jgi:hypothetical protein
LAYLGLIDLPLMLKHRIAIDGGVFDVLFDGWLHTITGCICAAEAAQT